jgi:hypothetical protein
VRDVEKAMTTLPAGEFFGEMAIFDEQPRSATAEVLDAGLRSLSNTIGNARLGSRESAAV